MGSSKIFVSKDQTLGLEISDRERSETGGVFYPDRSLEVYPD